MATWPNADHHSFTFLKLLFALSLKTNAVSWKRQQNGGFLNPG